MYHEHIVLNLFSKETDEVLETYLIPVEANHDKDLFYNLNTAYSETKKKENYGIEDFEEELDKQGVEYRKPHDTVNWEW